jgi:bifunctional non-homologous end joining protein LigD
MLKPMLASLADAPLADPHLVYEPKYDGIRAIVEADPQGHVRVWSRLGNEKTDQFPEIVDAIRSWTRSLIEPVILDGEIVALDERGRPAGFQHLQPRINLGEGRTRGGSAAPRVRSAFMAFDVLREGHRDWRDRPLTERRAALERLLRGTRSSTLRLSESVLGDGRSLYTRALANRWEGLIAKRADSRYQSGKRSPDWRKLKIVQEQEFVVGGWTEPRQTRSHFGALLVGVFDTARDGPRAVHAPRMLVYAGHVGTGFDEQELDRLMKLMRSIETPTCPFRDQPKGNERVHWVEPRLVVQVKFTEWTADGILRHPVYLGLRDDKKPEDVVREDGSKPHGPAPSRLQTERRAATVEDLITELRALERSRRSGVVTLPDGDQLAVTNLDKVFWPKRRLTKGDLLRYYVQMSPYILPVVRDRPLTMKRLPNGITGTTFYQHRAPDQPPPQVRVERVPGDAVPSRLIGGSLKTLLYMTQLAAISQDPWFSRVPSVAEADHVAFDLDPPPGSAFERVLDVARWIRDELEAIDVVGMPKTSGADGLHIYLPLPPGTSYEAGLLFCQIIATLVSQKHPDKATIERSVRARGSRVYIDYLQNVQGKTLASAYSARASSYAGVSAPLTWKEVDRGIRREDFTIETMTARVKKVGDLWKPLRTSKGADLSRIAKYTKA